MRFVEPSKGDSFAVQTIAAIIMAFFSVVTAVGLIEIFDWLYHAAVPMN